MIVSDCILPLYLDYIFYVYKCPGCKTPGFHTTMPVFNYVKLRGPIGKSICEKTLNCRFLFNSFNLSIADNNNYHMDIVLPAPNRLQIVF